MSNVLGVFKNVADVNSALKTLESNGYDKDDISVLASKNSVNTEEIDFDNNVVEGAKDVAVKGGLIGGLVGLLVGVGALTIPGIGLLFITGPIASALGVTGVAGTTLSGALTGSLVGGLAGALKELGADDEMAVSYEQDIKAGNIVVGVEADDEDTDNVVNILQVNGATRVTRLNAHDRD